jgi:hypothetical protein
MPLAVLGFLVSIAYIPIPSAVATPRWIAIEVGAFLILLFTSIRTTATHWIGAALILWCALSITWSVSAYDATGALLQLVALGAVFCIGSETEDLKQFWIALALGASINAVIAIFQVSGFHIFDPSGHTAGFPIGLFGNKNFLANFGALALIGTISLVSTKWFAPLIAGSATAALLPMSRGTIVAVVVAAGASLWKAKKLGWWIPLTISIVIALAILIDTEINPLRFERSIDTRLAIWDWTISNWSTFGWGLGNYGTVFPFEHASNDPFEIVFELGIGSVLYFWIIGICLVERKIPIEWAVLVTVLVESLFAFPLHQPATAFVAALVAGRIVGDRARRRRIELVGGDYFRDGFQDDWHPAIGALCEFGARRDDISF